MPGETNNGPRQKVINQILARNGAARRILGSSGIVVDNSKWNQKPGEEIASWLMGAVQVVLGNASERQREAISRVQGSMMRAQIPIISTPEAFAFIVGGTVETIADELGGGTAVRYDVPVIDPNTSATIMQTRAQVFPAINPAAISTVINTAILTS